MGGAWEVHGAARRCMALLGGACAAPFAFRRHIVPYPCPCPLVVNVKRWLGMSLYSMPGSTSVRDLRFVGKGACAAALERAGMGTVADVRAVVLTTSARKSVMFVPERGSIATLTTGSRRSPGPGRVHPVWWPCGGPPCSQSVARNGGSQKHPEGRSHTPFWSAEASTSLPIH